MALTNNQKEMRKLINSRITYLKKFCKQEAWTVNEKLEYIDKFR